MKKFFKIGCLGFIGLIVLAIIIGLAFGDDEKGTESQSDGTSKKEKKVESVGIGEDLKVGNVVFTVNEISTTNEIKDASGYISYKPEAEGAEFFVVNVTVKNEGKEAITTDSSFFKLINDDVEYSPSTILLSDSKFFLYEGINPGLAKEGNILFEIPEGLSDLTLNVQTGVFGTEQGKINLK